MQFATLGMAPEEISSVLDELVGGNDRAVGIVAAALVDSLLTDSLIQYMRRNEKMTKDLFGSGGACGDFGVKTQLGFLIGIYGDIAFRDLERVAKIRNRFAHRAKTNSFEHPDILNLTRNLELGDHYAKQEMGTQVRPWDSGILKDGVKWSPLQMKNPKIDWESARGRYMRTIEIVLQGLAFVPDQRMPMPLFGI